MGPEFAYRASMMSCAKSAWPLTCSAADLAWLHRRPAWLLVVHGVTTFFVFVLWRVQYPLWRTGVVALSMGALVALNYVFWLKERKHPHSAVWSECRMGLFTLLYLSVAVTGGLHSPLFVATLGSPLVLFVVFGWSPATRRMLVATSAWAIAMALAPSSWLGPAVPEPYFSVTAALLFIVSLAVSAHQLVTLTSAVNASMRDLLRARDQVASAALARARDLEFTGSKLSHELKNPLGAIKALVQLSERAAEDPDARERLKVVASEVERIHAIVQGYLTFSRPRERLQPQSISLGSVADEVLSVLEARALAVGVALHRRGDATADVDPRRLTEALLNLVANALEASGPGDVVEISISESDGAARLVVRDTGRGMSHEVLERLGEPFFTTRNDGTGLGVLLARAAFAQHGGMLEYSSAPGKGTTVTGTLPLCLSERSSHGAPALRR